MPLMASNTAPHTLPLQHDKMEFKDNYVGPTAGEWAGRSAYYTGQSRFEWASPPDATLTFGLGNFPTAGTTPDILPGFWGVYQGASEGETYLGLITRPDGSWEAIAQRLPRTLAAGNCYRMSIDLAHSRTYSGYNGPLKLRIFGGSSPTDRRELLYQSPVINHLQWKTYPLRFTLKSNIRYFILEAHYRDGPSQHAGNILLDRLTNLQPCPRA
ncbi:MAG: hypothetical protein HC821_01350 [Lewinella sp.]|nr:hypothetical protein [Lewinella sp.]